MITFPGFEDNEQRIVPCISTYEIQINMFQVAKFFHFNAKYFSFRPSELVSYTK